MGKPLDKLGGQRDFWNEEEHRLAAFEGIRYEVDVHLGLTGSGDAVQQRHAPGLLARPQCSVRLRLMGTQRRQRNRPVGIHLLASIHHAFAPFPQPFGFHAFDHRRIGICAHQYFLLGHDGIALAALLLQQLEKRSQNARLLRCPAVQFIQGRTQCRFVAQRLWQLEGVFCLGFVPFLPFLFGDNQLRLDELIDPSLWVLHVQYFGRFGKLEALAQFDGIEEYLRLRRHAAQIVDVGLRVDHQPGLTGQFQAAGQCRRHHFAARTHVIRGHPFPHAELARRHHRTVIHHSIHGARCVALWGILMQAAHDSCVPFARTHLHHHAHADFQCVLYTFRRIRKEVGQRKRHQYIGIGRQRHHGLANWEELCRGTNELEGKTSVIWVCQ